MGITCCYEKNKKPKPIIKEETKINNIEKNVNNQTNTNIQNEMNETTEIDIPPNDKKSESGTIKNEIKKPDENKNKNKEEEKIKIKKQENLYSIPLNSFPIIIEQEKNICKIESNKSEKIGTGFLCYIPFPDKYNLLPVLITNNHVLEKEDISNKNIVKFDIYKDKQKINYEILIDDSRKTYTNEKYDITIIEILKEKDGIEASSFLELDQLIYHNYNNIYKDKPIYLLHYQNESCEYSPGVIKRIKNDNFTIEHNCQTDKGSSGAPILCTATNCVLGIHRGYIENLNFAINIGSFIKYSIEEFNKINGKNYESEKMIENNEIDEISIIYSNYGRKLDDFEYFIDHLSLGETISNNKLFGENFVNNNKDICKIEISGKEYELSSYLEDEFDEHYKVLEIKLKGISKITDMSYMFCGCLSLMKLTDFNKINTSNVTNLKAMFAECKFFKDIPDLSKWNIENVEDISYMFFECRNLEKLCDISNWNTSNIEKMNFLFCGCSTLKMLPNISKWNTSKVENMSNMFSFCSSLKKIPDISLWNTDNVSQMDFMFFKCESLSSLPDLSKWNISKVENMYCMFSKCPLLSSLPKFNFNESDVNSESNETKKVINELLKKILDDN